MNFLCLLSFAFWWRRLVANCSMLLCFAFWWRRLVANCSVTATTCCCDCMIPCCSKTTGEQCSSFRVLQELSYRTGSVWEKRVKMRRAPRLSTECQQGCARNTRGIDGKDEYPKKNGKTWVWVSLFLSFNFSLFFSLCLFNAERLYGLVHVRQQAEGLVMLKSRPRNEYRNA